MQSGSIDLNIDKVISTWTRSRDRRANELVCDPETSSYQSLRSSEQWPWYLRIFLRHSSISTSR